MVLRPGLLDAGQRGNLPAGDQGHPKRQATNIHQFIISPVEAHSKKPDEPATRLFPSWATCPAWSSLRDRPRPAGTCGETRWRAPSRTSGHFVPRWAARKEVFHALCKCTQRLIQNQNENAFNLTKRQLVCFGGAAAVGIPSYLLARSSIGNTGAMFLMLAVMLPAFLLAMYERDGLPFEKVIRNIIRARFLRPGARLYQTQNLYAPFTCGAPWERRMRLQQAKSKHPGAAPPQRVKNGRPCPPSRQSPMCGCSRTACASSPAALYKNRGI